MHRLWFARRTWTCWLACACLGISRVDSVHFCCCSCCFIRMVLAIHHSTTRRAVVDSTKRSLLLWRCPVVHNRCYISCLIQIHLQAKRVPISSPGHYLARCCKKAHRGCGVLSAAGGLRLLAPAPGALPTHPDLPYLTTDQMLQVARRWTGLEMVLFGLVLC